MNSRWIWCELPGTNSKRWRPAGVCVECPVKKCKQKQEAAWNALCEAISETIDMMHELSDIDYYVGYESCYGAS
jgi:hypothetical protein